MATVAEVFEKAVFYHQSGNLILAESLYRQILQADPSHAEALHFLGVLAHQAGNHQSAIELLRQAIAQNPFAESFHFHLALFHKALGQMIDAIQSFQKTLDCNPNHMEALNQLGIALSEEGRTAEATECFRRMVLIDPNNADAHNNLGKILKDQGQAAEAVPFLMQALCINPNHVDAHNNLGSSFKEMGQISQAVECFRQALRINPNYANAHNNLGNALYEQGFIAEGEECFRQALAIEPDSGLVYWNRRFQRLRYADFEGSWEDFHRYEALSGMSGRYNHKPRWDGSNLEGKTVLVYVEYAEQGLGDTLQFARYLPMIKQRGGKVILECQPAVVRLFTGFLGIDQLFGCGGPIPPFDFQIPLFHLLAVFRTTLETIPATIPYLAADPILVQHWRTILQPMAGFKIGIVWQGSMRRPYDRRSLSLTHFKALAMLEGVRLVSLQVGPGLQQLAEATFPVTDLGSQFNPNSMEDLAATLVSLDLVITVDTAVAHLAGALGVPVWVALPMHSCWRWLLDRADSPWYPAMRLFRQRRAGDWGEVFERICDTLGSAVLQRV